MAAVAEATALEEEADVAAALAAADVVLAVAEVIMADTHAEAAMLVPAVQPERILQLHEVVPCIQHVLLAQVTQQLVIRHTLQEHMALIALTVLMAHTVTTVILTIIMAGTIIGAAGVVGAGLVAYGGDSLGGAGSDLGFTHGSGYGRP